VERSKGGIKSTNYEKLSKLYISNHHKTKLKLNTITNSIVRIFKKKKNSNLDFPNQWSGFGFCGI
jgi:hypothetical protein